MGGLHLLVKVENLSINVISLNERTICGMGTTAQSPRHFSLSLHMPLLVSCRVFVKTVVALRCSCTAVVDVMGHAGGVSRRWLAKRETRYLTNLRSTKSRVYFLLRDVR